MVHFLKFRLQMNTIFSVQERGEHLCSSTLDREKLVSMCGGSKEIVSYWFQNMFILFLPLVWYTYIILF